MLGLSRGREQIQCPSLQKKVSDSYISCAQWLKDEGREETTVTCLCCDVTHHTPGEGPLAANNQKSGASRIALSLL